MASDVKVVHAKAQPDPTADPAIKSESPKDSKGSPVPEPTTLLLVGTGLVGLALSSKRWRRPPLGADN